MRISFLLLLLIATLFGSGFWYTQIDTSCDIPIRYKIGNIDPRFGTSAEKIKEIALRAEAVWEKPFNAELFIYDESGDLPIHLVFDERQENANAEAELREDLDAKEGMSESVAAQYEALIAEFRSVKKQYEARVIAYETELGAYNAEVASWNEKGGVSETTLAKLKAAESKLRVEQTELEALAKKLNALAAELNRIGARGNSLITDYNTIVKQYNSRFSETDEFTQGDYTGEAIDIYQFNNEPELTVVLAHEFGHALALDHVANEVSIMYPRMEKQSIATGVTEEDIAEYVRVCNEKGLITSLMRVIGRWF